MVKKKKGSANKKGKRPHKNKKTGKKYLMYSEGGVRKNKFCPRCGPGVFLGGGNNRWHCGKCHYTEFERKE